MTQDFPPVETGGPRRIVQPTQWETAAICGVRVGAEAGMLGRPSTDASIRCRRLRHPRLRPLRSGKAKDDDRSEETTENLEDVPEWRVDWIRPPYTQAIRRSG